MERLEINYLSKTGNRQMNKEREKHWEKVYETKQSNELSWTEKRPASLELIYGFNLDKTARIIDVGGGDSKLVDHLLDGGYENITVLDISSKAIERAKHRQGEKAEKIKWIVSDVIDFQPEGTYDLWHDRATFHFLVRPKEIQQYIRTVEKSVSGFLVIATFSDKGPLKCSGLNIHRYNESELTTEFSSNFQKIRCFTEDHLTPFNTLQNFLFCSFKRTITKR